MTKIVINKCYGGFSVNREALHKLRKMGCQGAIDEVDLGEKYPDTDEVNTCDFDSYCREIDRDDPMLVELVENTEGVSGPFAKLAVVEIPDGTRWTIEEYGGLEHIAEQHEVWS